MISVNHRVQDVKEWFQTLKEKSEFVIDKTGCKMLEIVGATFLADEEAIFRISERVQKCFTFAESALLIILRLSTEIRPTSAIMVPSVIYSAIGT